MQEDAEYKIKQLKDEKELELSLMKKDYELQLKNQQEEKVIILNLIVLGGSSELHAMIMTEMFSPVPQFSSSKFECYFLSFHFFLMELQF